MPAKSRLLSSRFSLRALIALVSLTAIVLAVWTGRARRQQAAVAALRDLHVGVHYDYEGTRWESKRGEPCIGARLLGIDYFHSVKWVFVTVGDDRDSLDTDVEAALPPLEQLPRLRHVQLVFWEREFGTRAADMLRRDLRGVQIELEPGP